MLTMKVGHGQWPGSGAASASKPARARVPTRAADEDRGQFAAVETEHEPK